MKNTLRAISAVVLVLVGVEDADGAGLRIRQKSRDAHPVVGVIDMLKGLEDKVVAEGKAEEVTYAKFETWCKTSLTTLQKSVSASKESIDTLGSEIEAKTAANETLTAQISKLADELLEYEAAQAKADKQRQDENGLYVKSDADLASTADAFDTAIAALEGAKPASLEQVKAVVKRLPSAAFGSLSDDQLGQLSVLLQDRASSDPADKKVPDFLAKGDYGDHVEKYTFKSDGVVGLLKELQAKFKTQRVEGTKAETNAAHAHSLAKSARDAATTAASESKTQKESELGAVGIALSTAKQSLQDAEADLAADSQSSEDTKRTCQMKSSEWEERSAIRKRELEALAAGVEILAKVAGVRTEAPVNPALPASPLAAPDAGRFLQVHADPKDTKARALTLLRDEAARLGSKSFDRFADELAAKLGGPFDDVNGAIQKMIFRLMAEQTDEDEHKNWCDMELGKSNASKLEKEEKLEELELKIKEGSATVTTLTLDMEAATAGLADLDKYIEEATAVRTAGREENEAAIKDASEAQAAIAKAVAVLAEFYKDAGGSALLQRSAAPVDLPDTPSTWDAGYTGAADPTAQPEGIIAVLEKISSDFSEMEAGTKAQEVTDQKNYEEDKKSAEIEKARRQKEAEMKLAEKKRVLSRLDSLRKSQKSTMNEHGAVEQYLKELEPACLEGDSTYEDRKADRDAEVQALKEAQVMLSDAFVKQPASGADAASAGVVRLSAERPPASSTARLPETPRRRALRSVSRH